jgi:hypothetical protein
MAKLERLNGPNGELKEDYIFWCPGCEGYHAYDKRWKFNGDFERPTFHPSLLYHENNRSGQLRCHLFLKDGVLDFLTDCGHKLAGKKVPLPEIPD